MAGGRVHRSVGLTILAVGMLVVGLAGCSSSPSSTTAPPGSGQDRGDGTGGNVTTNQSTGTTARGAGTRTPKATAATLSGPITVGEIARPADARNLDFAAQGYVEEEFFAEGTATAYTPDGEQGGDGMWKVSPGTTAPYKTRLVVRRPSDPSRFNGSVAVEWFNVSGGLEASPDFSYLGNELLREGYVWVGVSVQALGINGGRGIVQATGETGGGLPKTNPERYGSLVHPGDRYAYDIYSQIGAALRSPGAVPVLGSLPPARILAVGESQSAIYLTSYADAIQPIADVFDGFFIHSRGGRGAPLDADNLGGRTGGGGVRIRTDLDVPVFVFETETDLGSLLNFGPARQPDTDKIRVWEVAGTAHADAYMVGAVASALGCNGRINEGPHHYVVKAAFHAFNRWVADGTLPPTAPPLSLASDDPPDVQRDADGNAVGGIRTPSVDVPVAVLSGSPAPGSSPICSLFGTTTPFDAATLAARYPTRAAYEQAFQAALDQAIAAGYVLPADRAEYLAEAQKVEAALP